MAATGAVVAVAAAVAVTTVDIGGGPGPEGSNPRLTIEPDPPRLALEQGGEATTAGGTVTLAGKLPAGPRRGRVAELPRGSGAEEATRLGLALGLDQPAQRVGDEWVVPAGERQLRVSDAGGRPWTLGPARAGDLPVSGPSRGAVLPSTDAVRRAAQPVLAGIGLDRADVRLVVGSGTLDVVAAPRVDGLPTSGLETRLRYDRSVRLVGASGHLGLTTADGLTYPLIGAEEALAALPAGPEIGCPRPNPACGERIVTGARPGLVLKHDRDDRALLIPAWLYDLRGGGAPLAAVSVDPAYLTVAGDGPAPVPAPGQGSAPATGGGPGQGSDGVGPAAPGPSK